MKRLAIIAIFSLLLSELAAAGDVIFKIKGSFFYPSDSAFRDIYGGGMVLGVETSTELSKNFEMWVEGSYFSKKGELSLTREVTKLKLIPVGGGIRYKLPIRGFHLYGGLGINYYYFRETNRIGDVISGELGGTAKIGSLVQMKGGWILDIYLNYSYCKIKPADFKINIGGIEAGIGIGYRYD